MQDAGSEERNPPVIWMSPHCALDKDRLVQLLQYATRPSGAMNSRTELTHKMMKERHSVRDVALRSILHLS